VTNELKSAINSIKTGQIEIKNDKDGNIGTTIGKKSFSNDKLLQNYKAIMDVVWKEKPSSVKGNYILSAYLTSTMGISYKFKAKAI
jgi:large subunit ribosomal protein L1